MTWQFGQVTTDYETIYRKTAHALGSPSKEIVQFFRSYEKNHARVLDIGCGQGRDAHFVGRLGHRVTGVDLPRSGIRNLLKDAASEELQIDARVADIRTYHPEFGVDILLLDRTLHMLTDAERSAVLGRLLSCINVESFVLIVDERRNIAQLQSIFDASLHNWRAILKNRGLLFLSGACKTFAAVSIDINPAEASRALVQLGPRTIALFESCE